MTNKLLKLAAGTAIAALALTGCGAAQSEAGTAADSSSASAQDARPVGASSDGPAQNVREPMQTEVLGEQSAGGLKAFGYYWFDLHNFALQTGDTSRMIAASAQNCEYCAAKAEDVSAVYQEGGWIAGGQPVVMNVYPEVTEGEADATAVLEFSTRPTTVFNSDGEEVSAEDGVEPTLLTIEATYTDGAWTMVSVTETPDAEVPEA